MYTISDHSIIVSPYNNELIARDHHKWEDFSDADMKEHLANIHAFFLDRITGLADDNYYLRTTDEKELSFMLDALLQTKRYVQEYID